MPYKKRTKRYGRKRAPTSSYAKYGPSIASIASAAATIVAKRYLNTEQKFKDRNATSNPDSVNGQLVALNLLAQGTSNEERVGSSVRNTSCFVQGRVNIHASASSTTVRLALVHDSQANGTTPVYSSAAGGNGIYENASVDSWRDLGNNRRYRVLASSRVTVDTDDPERRFKMMVKMPYQKGKVSFYPGVTTGTITAISTGSLHLVMFSDEATNTPAITWRSRVRYIDN